MIRGKVANQLSLHAMQCMEVFGVGSGSHVFSSEGEFDDRQLTTFAKYPPGHLTTATFLFSLNGWLIWTKYGFSAFQGNPIQPGIEPKVR